MYARSAKRLVYAALLGILGSGLAGPVLAQAPAAPPASDALASILGVWSGTRECRLEADTIILTPNRMFDLLGQSAARRVVTYEPVWDGIMVATSRLYVMFMQGTTLRTTSRNTTGPARLVLRRDGDALRIVRRIRPDGREQTAAELANDPDALPVYACDPTAEVWSATPDCRPDGDMFILTARFLFELWHDRSERMIASYEPTPDGMVMTVLRNYAMRAGGWVMNDPSDHGLPHNGRIVWQRQGTTLRMVGGTTAEGQEFTPELLAATFGVTTFHACQ